jgi:hypothetical protein
MMKEISEWSRTVSGSARETLGKGERLGRAVEEFGGGRACIVQYFQGHGVPPTMITLYRTRPRIGK